MQRSRRARAFAIARFIAHVSVVSLAGSSAALADPIGEKEKKTDGGAADPCPPGYACDPAPPAGASGSATIEIVLPEGSTARAPTPVAAPQTAARPVLPPPPAPEEQDAAERKPEPKQKARLAWFSHGFRLGYSFMSKLEGDEAVGAEGTAKDGEGGAINYKEKFGLKSPHMFLLGYELTQRMVGHSWLNVIFIENVTLAGIEQSRVLPSANLILGFELDESFQLGVGVNLAPVKEKSAHMVFAAGWTPRVGSFHTPVHAFFMPDVDGQHRTGVTVGVNW